MPRWTNDMPLRMLPHHKLAEELEQALGWTKPPPVRADNQSAWVYKRDDFYILLGSLGSWTLYQAGGPGEPATSLLAGSVDLADPLAATRIKDAYRARRRLREGELIVWIQKWEESERGWGQRPDGYTLHLEFEDINLFVQEMRDNEAKAGYGPGNAPDEYSRPCGRPYQTKVTEDKILKRLAASEHGVWGPNNNYPKPVSKGANQTGWCSMKK